MRISTPADRRSAGARRREQIAREAEFYGAMDGAARFSQRDALATILITAINIIGRIPDRRFSVEHAFRSGPENLHGSHRRRWPRHDDPVAAGFGGRRHRRHADFERLDGRHRIRAAVSEQERVLCESPPA